MPRLTKDFTDNLNNLSLTELRSIVVEFAKKNENFCNFVILSYFKDEEYKIQLFEETKQDVIYALNSGARGNIYRQLAAQIDKSIKVINNYRDLTGDKVDEARLLHFLLNYIFEYDSQNLGTCFSVFDSKLARTVSRFIALVNKKLHNDYKVEFEDDINRYLDILHNSSNHLDFVYSLPQKI